MPWDETPDLPKPNCKTCGGAEFIEVDGEERPCPTCQAGYAELLAVLNDDSDDGPLPEPSAATDRKVYVLVERSDLESLIYVAAPDPAGEDVVARTKTLLEESHADDAVRNEIYNGPCAPMQGFCSPGCTPTDGCPLRLIDDRATVVRRVHATTGNAAAGPPWL